MSARDDQVADLRNAYEMGRAAANRMTGLHRGIVVGLALATPIWLALWRVVVR